MRGNKRAGHKLYMNNLFSPDVLYRRAIKCYATVRENHRVMLWAFGSNILKMKQDDINARVGNNLTNVHNHQQNATSVVNK
jgi:hypothetical protein